ncbi:MAG: hypothetical protein M3173_01140, partial [Chloroflexota bacterium]|nr:hypothetical protein [Chloroflexota bacterium]
GTGTPITATLSIAMIAGTVPACHLLPVALNRRIWLPVMVVVALLTMGIVAALVLRESYGGEDEPEGPLAVIQEPSAPTESRSDKVATPTVVTATPAGSGGEAVVASPLPASPVSVAARATSASQLPETPTTSTPQAIAIPELTPTSDPTVVNDIREATPIARPARGDGTGGAVLLPIVSTPIPEIGPPNRIRTPDAD